MLIELIGWISNLKNDVVRSLNANRSVVNLDMNLSANAVKDAIHVLNPIRATGVYSDSFEAVFTLDTGDTGKKPLHDMPHHVMISASCVIAPKLRQRSLALVDKPQV